ncbi:MAG: hypothetical protein QNK92_10615 [Amylibacter sp.]
MIVLKGEEELGRIVADPNRLAIEALMNTTLDAMLATEAKDTTESDT